MATAGVSKGPVENKPGDTSILRVIEAYCASGKAISNIRECVHHWSSLDHRIIVATVVCVVMFEVQCFLPSTKSLTNVHVQWHVSNQAKPNHLPIVLVQCHVSNQAKPNHLSSTEITFF